MVGTIHVMYETSPNVISTNASIVTGLPSTLVRLPNTGTTSGPIAFDRVSTAPWFGISVGVVTSGSAAWFTAISAPSPPHTQSF